MKKNFINISNKVFMLSILLGTILMALLSYKASYLLTYLMAIPIIIAPFIFEKTVFKFGEIDKLVYYMFTFFAYFLGSVVGLYNLTWWYDLLMHFLSGFVIGYAGLFALQKLHMYDGNKKIFNFIFFLFFTIGAAGVWEIFEFLSDCIISTNLQHNIETGVVDTMQDLICGASSGLIFSILVCLKKPKKASIKVSNILKK